MDANAQLWRAVWPPLGRALAIELPLAFAIMAVAWATLAAAAAPAVYKARFTEVWWSVLGSKLELTERAALEASAEVPAIDAPRALTDRVDQRIEGSSVVLSGTLRGGPAYEIRFAAQVAPDSAVALWSCRATNLTGARMPSQCRQGKGP